MTKKSKFKKRKVKEIIIFTTTPILKGTFDSHVKSLAKILSFKLKKSYIISICVFISNKNKNEKNKIKEIEKQISGKIYVLPRNFNFLSHILKLKKTIRNRSIVIIHSQNYYSSFLAVLLKNFFYKKIYVHADLKGLVPEESLFFSNELFFLRILKFILAKLFIHYFINKVDSLGVVSQKFADYIKKKYHYRSKIFIFPSVYDNKVFYRNKKLRCASRKELNIKNNDICIVYSGGDQKWQNLEYFFKLVKNNYHSNIKFLVITQLNKDSLIKKYDLFKFVSKIKFIKGVNTEIVNKYLNAGDFGFIVRKNNIVNYVSSPTKFLEYLATGNKLLISENIGDFSKLVAKNNLGVIIKENEAPSEVFKKIKEFNKNFSKNNFILKSFSLQENVKNLIKLYQNLESKK